MSDQKLIAPKISAPKIVQLDDTIRVIEESPEPIVRPGATIHAPVAEENIEEEIPTIEVKAQIDPAQLEKDTSWLGEAAAAEKLEKDQFVNTTEEIHTGSIFQDLPDQKIEDAPVAVAAEEEEVILPNIEPAIPTPNEDWDSNVGADVPHYDEDVQPGMEASQAGPVISDYEDIIEDDMLAPKAELPAPQEQIIVETMIEPVVETPGVEYTDTPAAEATDAEEPAAQENILNDKEPPLIPSYGYFRSPVKETIIPLQREELQLQFEAILPDEQNDSKPIQQMKMRAVSDASTFPGHISRATQFTSQEQARLTDVFQEMKGPIGSKTKIDDKVYGDAFSGKMNSKPLQTTSILGGDKSFYTAMALISGIRRVAFYNSGFNATIRPPVLSDLHKFYMRVRSSAQEFGRQFGQYFFIPADIELKVAGMELFKSLILECNLENWRNPGVFEEHLSILDYDVMLWGMATLMFPEGTEVEMFCNKRDCGKVDLMKVDLVKMRFNDYSRISAEAIKYTCSSDMSLLRTSADLKQYREELLHASETLNLNNEWSVVVETPSFARVIEAGEAYAADMATRVQQRNPLDVADYIRCKYFRMFSPWIQQISFLDTRTGHQNHWTDPKYLPEIIEALQLKPETLPLDTKLVDFMNSQRVSYFGYLYSECPHCHTVPDMAVNNIIPCDMQQSFFTLTMDRTS